MGTIHLFAQHENKGGNKMKSYMSHKAAALLCIFSMLLTVGMTGCGKTQNENSSNSTSETVSVSESSERLVDQSQPSATSSKENSGDKTSQKENSHDKTSKTVSEAASSADQSEPSAASSEAESSDKTSEAVSGTESSEESAAQSRPSEASSTESSEVSADDFTYSEDSSGNITLTRYNGREAAPAIPATVDGKTVTAIGESCFAGNTSIKTIVIPDGVTDIGDYAFECCTYLEDITFPDSLKTIGEGAFSACTALSSADLTDNIAVIKRGAFLYCKSIKSVELPASLEELGNFAFSNCSQLTSVTFKGDKIKNLSERLFYQCTKLTDININHTLDSIGKRTFNHCTSLTSVSFPGKLQSVGENAFCDCSSLESVSLQAVSVAETAYARCFKLPEEMRPEPPIVEEESETKIRTEMPEPDTIGSIAGDASLFDEDTFSRYRIISNDEFEDWSKKYVDFCNENGIPTERNAYFYTYLYKGEVIPFYMGMVSAENHDPDMSRDAAGLFGDGYEETFLMMNHGLYTELKRCRMCDDLVLYSGVYDSQLQAAAGTGETPSLEQMKDCIGQTFTDPIMISTTTDIEIACKFSDTLFIIYASKENIDKLGAFSIDSVTNTGENEILMSKNATYRILDVGTMAVQTQHSYNQGKVLYRNYIKVELL